MKKEYIEWMLEAGWTRLPGGDNGYKYFTIPLSEGVFLTSLAKFRNSSRRLEFEDNGRIGFTWYSEAHVAIFSEAFKGWRPEVLCLADRLNSRSRTEPGGSLSFIKNRTRELIEWAESISPIEELKGQAELKRGYHLGQIMKHFTALALLGETEMLETHLNGKIEQEFEYITQNIPVESIEKAILLSKDPDFLVFSKLK